MFKIDVKGIKEVQKALDDLKRTQEPDTFIEWANRIERTAKQICNDHDCKRIKLIKTGQGKVNFQFADKEAIDCGIKSIQTHLNSMPLIQQGIFKELIQEFEMKKNDATIN